MSDPFFNRPALRKRKKTEKKAAQAAAPSKSRKNETERGDASDISSDSDDLDAVMDDADEEEEDLMETAAEKRLRLAKQYLSQVRDEMADEGGFDAKDVDREILAHRLKEDVMEQQGKMYLKIADRIATETKPRFTRMVGRHNRPLVGICAKDHEVYTVDKSGLVQKWALMNFDGEENDTSDSTEKIKVRPVRFARSSPETDHKGLITCAALSGDGKWLVTGGADHHIVVRDTETLEARHCWKHHRDTVLALSFRKDSNEMFSASADRSIKVWSLDQMSYVETLFGHQDGIVDISSLAQERCVTAGSRDRTARLWKIVEESQLVFRGGSTSMKATGGFMEGSLDCVRMVDEEHFVSGSDNGALALWSLQRKKPVHTLPIAHGMQPQLPPSKHSAETQPEDSNVPALPYPITAIATIPYANVFVTGSYNGDLKLWKISDTVRSFEPVQLSSTLKVPGFVNHIQASLYGKRGHEHIQILVACGREPRYGRWKTMGGVQNAAYIFDISLVSASAESLGEE
ncbi:U3 snoRNP-associated protein Rrp9 [Schizosaccharomyces japonicus yFS275]|uniref:U3 snoRNP-associated protein Rrp9 n=1 Tax=Schizosaccharomyces japonicus (strain yFS275 / FY16936) TaxID=402676 RepID=B6K346_SCHJY|nr:U3 snoRNP-associated protein Rrp9 [Schizosaccharomyces japonicus yFS275]EEB07903.1 U3 snoRNP-associated protein Rrp9 [Schizosaccharomyces japonicus yFS275]